MSDQARRIRIAAIGALALVTVARAFQAPAGYAIGQWLLTWQHGFAKRGLVGTIAAPLLAWKGPDEVRFALQTLSSASLLALVVAFTFTAEASLGAARTPLTRRALLTSIVAFACSGWLVFAGSINGFFDHFLALAVLAALPLVGTRLRGLVPVIAALALAIHEAFLVYGLPVLVFATWLAAPPGPRGVARALVELLVPVGLIAALIVGLPPSAEAIAALRADVAAYGILSDQAAGNAVFHLTQDVIGSRASLDTVLERIGRTDLLRAALPTVLLALGWCAACLWNTPRRGLIALLPLAFAPLALHVVAWDTTRFSLMVVFQSFALWAAVASRLPAPDLSARASGLVTGLAALVIANNLLGEVPLMQDSHDGDGVLAPRRGPSPQSFQGCGKLFDNSNFERGHLGRWKGGDGFEVREGRSKNGGRKVVGSHGDWFLRTGAKDAAVGTLTSPSFELKGGTVLVAVGGGDDPEHLRVSLRVDDDEVAWATGSGNDELVAHGWNVDAWAGKQATIVITDQSTGKWGHLNVDGLCTFREK